MNRRHQLFDLGNLGPHSTDAVNMWVAGYRLHHASQREGLAQALDLLWEQSAAAGGMPAERTDVLRIGRMILGVAVGSNALTGGLVAPLDPVGNPFPPLPYDQACAQWLTPPNWGLTIGRVGPSLVLFAVAP